MKKLCLVLVLALIISAMQGVAEVEAFWDNDVTHPYICEEAEKIFSNSEIHDYLPSIMEGAYHEDEYDHIYALTTVFDILTIPHFWDADMGDDHLVKAPITGTPTFPNANKKAKHMWNGALAYYALGDKDSAYERLGHVCHLVQDMGVPAHAHEDFHVDDDCYEDWMAENSASWNANDAIAAGGLISIPVGPASMLDFPVYYLMYTTNQYADYFASDDYDGDTNDRWGWINYSGWPSSPKTTDDIADNDAGDNDDDGDLSAIASYSYVYSMRATATLYKLFSETVGLVVLPPTTTLNVGDPEWTAPDGNLYVNSDTQFTLTAISGIGGSEVASTAYCIYNSTYSSSFLTYDAPFRLEGLADGTYYLEYNSTDAAGNMEPENFAIVNLDNTPPLLTAVNPQEGLAFQDGVTFNVSAWDLSQVASVTFSIRNTDGSIISTEFESMEASQSLGGNWELYFDTIDLPDGLYLFVADGTDVLGSMAITTVLFGTQNWASAELLPTLQSSKAGRTLPVKFTLRVAASVNPNQPFIYNEELTVKIYAADNPTIILQMSTFGDEARDYRIDTLNEQYITNFRTLKTPRTYVVEIWREALLIGTFDFSTVK